jgi:hypothetical protein
LFEFPAGNAGESVVALVGALIAALRSLPFPYDSPLPAALMRHTPQARIRYGVICSTRFFDIDVNWSEGDVQPVDSAWEGVWSALEALCSPQRKLDGWGDGYDIPLELFHAAIRAST